MPERVTQADRLLERIGDADAPPALQRVASGETNEPPKITRSLTSFLNGVTAFTNGDDVPGSGGASLEPPLVTQMSSFERAQQNAMVIEPPAEAMPPPLVKRKSSRLSFTDLADIFQADP